jgi:hypothetical protein
MEDYSSMAVIDYVSLASEHLRKLIFNIAMLGGDDFQLVVNRLWQGLEVLDHTTLFPCCCRFLYKTLRIKTPSGPKKIDSLLYSIFGCSSLPRLSDFIDFLGSMKQSFTVDDLRLMRNILELKLRPFLCYDSSDGFKG